ncbi:MAG: NAD(P)/FAD-dependent oxidoreductase, partial [Acidimicrobiales bacterium]
LDAALVARARAAKVTTFEGARFESLIEDRGKGVRVRLSGLPETRARFVVAADGAWSEVRRAVVGLDPRERRPDWMAWRAYLVGADREKTSPMWVWFERPLLPGYGWSFPLADGAINIGVVTAGISGKRFADAWRTTIDGPFVRSLVGADASLEAPARAWPIPARLDVSALSALDDRVLFVGDAAGVADPFTGEGIGQALETGIVAARAITDKFARGPAQVAAAYRQAIAASLAKDHAIARVCGRLFAHASSASAVLRVVDSAPFVRRNVARWLFEDYPRAVVTSPGAWQDAARLRPGAFAK